MRDKELLTIVTTVFNRAKLMERLFYSLMKQKNKNFVWMVVDDGSDDDLKSVMSKFEGQTDFPITFYQKENGGKHTALNLAFSKLETELVIMVDSDDWLLPDATDIIEKKWKTRTEKNIAGCIFLRGKNADTCIGKSELPDGIYDMIDVMFSHHIEGDKVEVFRSDILKEYRFPVFENEKFMGEGYIWYQIYLKYRMMYVNQIIHICEYLEGGLTKQGRKLRISCPLGGMEYSKICFNKRFPIKERIKRAWLFVCYGKFAKLGYREIVEKSGAKLLITCNYVFGVILYIYWKIKYLGR